MKEWHNNKIGIPKGVQLGIGPLHVPSIWHKITLLVLGILPRGQKNSAVVPTVASIFSGTPIKLPFFGALRGGHFVSVDNKKNNILASY